MSFFLVCGDGEAMAATRRSPVLDAMVRREREFHAAKRVALVVGGLSRLREVDLGSDDSLFGPGRVWLVFEGFLHRDCTAPAALPADGADAVATLLCRGELAKRLPQLHGAFAALVVAPHNGHWLLFCDRLGARSAFYTSDDQRTILSDRCDWIARFAGLGAEPNSAYVSSMFGLRAGPPPGHSPFRAISALRPAESIHCNGSRIALRRDPFEMPELRQADAAKWARRFTERLWSAVEGSFSPSERPCIMLSGGLDSGPVAAIAQARMQGAGRRLSAISWTLERFPACDEGRFVRSVTTHLGMELTQFPADSMLPLRFLDSSMAQADTPDFNPYREAILKCYELAAAHGHKVIFNGAAGDFLYPDFSFLMADQLRRREFGELMRWLWFGLRTHGVRSLVGYPPLRQAVRWLIHGPDVRHGEPPSWLTSKGRSAFVPENWPPEAEDHPFPRYARRLLGTTLPRGTAFENTVAARYGLERRDPLVNPDLVDLFLTLPFSLTFRKGTSKWIMREAMRGPKGLPESIRTKGRTGLLQDYLKAGIDSNRSELERFLWKTRPEWQQWLRPEPVRNALADPGATDRERALMHIAVGYGLWLNQLEAF